MDDTTLPDKELVALCLQGQRRYQEQLYQRYADEMYGVALLYAENEEDACDILQDAFVKVFRHLQTFHFDSSLRTWIRRIVVNTALDHYRKRKREQENRQEYTQQVEVNVQDILPQLSANELLSLLNELPHKAAMVLKLFAIEGYAHKEIADMMGITEGTSKSQLNRARELLRQLIKVRFNYE